MLGVDARRECWRDLTRDISLFGTPPQATVARLGVLYRIVTGGVSILAQVLLC